MPQKPSPPRANLQAGGACSSVYLHLLQPPLPAQVKADPEGVPHSAGRTPTPVKFCGEVTCLTGLGVVLLNGHTTAHTHFKYKQHPSFCGPCIGVSGVPRPGRYTSREISQGGADTTFLTDVSQLEETAGE